MSKTKQPVPDQPVIVNTKALPEALFAKSSNEIPADTVAPSHHESIVEADAETAMTNIFLELRQAEHKADATVLTAPHDGRWAAAASRFQSLIASGEIEDIRYSALNSGGLEAQFDTRRLAGWLQVVWEKVRNSQALWS